MQTTLDLLSSLKYGSEEMKADIDLTIKLICTLFSGMILNWCIPVQTEIMAITSRSD